LLAVGIGFQGKRLIFAHKLMQPAINVPHRRKLIAYVSPMALFLGLIALSSGLKAIGGSFWLSSPEYWIYPVQTVLCAGLVWWFRHEYDFRNFRQPIFVFAVGLAVFVLWVSPQVFFGFAPRTEGFNPNVFANQPPLYWPTIGLRFLRLVIVVPLVEEIFWRGFLLRYLIDEKFYAVPFGKFSSFSFWGVSAMFALGHSRPDWIAAFITGMVYNAVAYRTKSLTSCVIVHAVTNLLLGLWIMRTQQWGFW
jgi:CAAX prenyl protease-like protein